MSGLGLVGLKDYRIDMIYAISYGYGSPSRSLSEVEGGRGRKGNIKISSWQNGD